MGAVYEAEAVHLRNVIVAVKETFYDEDRSQRRQPKDAAPRASEKDEKAEAAKGTKGAKGTKEAKGEKEAKREKRAVKARAAEKERQEDG